MSIQIEYNDFNMHTIREIYGSKTEAYVQPSGGAGYDNGRNIIVAITRETIGGVEYIFDDMGTVARLMRLLNKAVNEHKMPCVFGHA